jgi:hypothetical protein
MTKNYIKMRISRDKHKFIQLKFLHHLNQEIDIKETNYCDLPKNHQIINYHF